MSQAGLNQAGQGECGSVCCGSLGALVVRVVADNGIPECASRAADRLERLTRDVRERGMRGGGGREN